MFIYTKGFISFEGYKSLSVSMVDHDFIGVYGEVSKYSMTNLVIKFNDLGHVLYHFRCFIRKNARFDKCLGIL